jgi:hypothetical protein
MYTPAFCILDRTDKEKEVIAIDLHVDVLLLYIVGYSLRTRRASQPERFPPPQKQGQLRSIDPLSTPDSSHPHFNGFSNTNARRPARKLRDEVVCGAGAGKQLCRRALVVE